MGPPSISVVYTAECHLFEQCPECAATPMASAARTVEADDIWKKKQDFAIWVLLHRDDGVILLRVNERLQSVVLQVGFQFFIEVQDSFVRVSDLEILADNPWRPSFPWESVSLSVDLLLQKRLFSWNVLWWYSQSLSLSYSREPRNVPAINFASVIVFDVFSSALDFEKFISLVQIIASVGRPAPEDTSLLKIVRQLQKLKATSNEKRSTIFILEAEYVTNRSISSINKLDTFKLLPGDLQDIKYWITVEMDKQTVTRWCKRTRRNLFHYHLCQFIYWQK